MDLKLIMDRYDQQRARFGAGEKRKEFSNAFVIPSAVAHAMAKSGDVALVSTDPHAKKACELRYEKTLAP